MGQRQVIRLPNSPLPMQVGAKARNINWLLKNGFRAPVTFVIPYPASDAARRSDDRIENGLREEIETLLDPQKLYAVRSSASLEDSLGHSFAGQFQSFLSIRGTSEILKSIRSIVDTAQAPRVQAYIKKANLPHEALRMAVILQEMVLPRAYQALLSAAIP